MGNSTSEQRVEKTQLGAVTANFALLDSNVQFIIWILLFGNDLDQQPFGKAVTSELSFARRGSLLSTSYRLRFPGKDYSQLDALCKKLRAVEVKRNHTMHSMWIGGYDGKAFRFKTTAKDQLKHQSEHTDVDAVWALAKEVEETASEVQGFLVNMMNTLGE